MVKTLRFTTTELRRVPHDDEKYLVLRKDGSAAVMTGHSADGCRSTTHWARVNCLPRILPTRGDGQ